MKKILFAVLLFIPHLTWADNFYVDIEYKQGSLLLPEKSSKLLKLIKEDNKTMVVTATLLSEKDSQEIILVPPKVLENFELVSDKLVRLKSEDVRVKQAHFQSPTEQLLLQVDFYSVDKSNATEFVKSLESLAKAYSSANLTPALSEVAHSALDVVGSVLLANKEVSLRYRGGIDLNDGSYTKTLYFDDEGRINENKTGEEKTAATIEFNINGYSERKVHFNLSFSEQSVDEQSIKLFEDFKSTSDKDSKLSSCNTLYDHLRQKNTKKSATDLIAIAINETRWAQDETKTPCLTPEIAIDYRNKHGLKRIVNCVKNSCLMTKRLIIVSLGVKDYEKLKPFTGGEDITSLSCFDSQKPKRIYSWKGFDVGDTIGEGFDTYHFSTCLKSDSDKDRFDHTLTWYNKKVYSHSCEVSTTASEKCS